MVVKQNIIAKAIVDLLEEYSSDVAYVGQSIGDAICDALYESREYEVIDEFDENVFIREIVERIDGIDV